METTDVPPGTPRLRSTEEVLPEVYDDLRRVANRMVARETVGLSFQPTALVHEACLRVLKPNPDTKWAGPSHFAAIIVEVMRRILVENARRKRRLKRGGGRLRVDIDPGTLPGPAGEDDVLLAVDEALTGLAAVNVQWAELVKLRYFLGMTIPEAAAAMGIAPRTADGWWASAREWLRERIAIDIAEVLPTQS